MTPASKVRITIGIGVLALLAAVSFGLSVSSTYAGDENGAILDSGFTCGLGRSITGLPDSLYTNDSRAVLTPSGNAVVTCHFEIPEGAAPSEAIIIQGASCTTLAGNTSDSQIVLTPGGEAHLTCHVNGSDDSPAVAPPISGVID